MTDRQRWQAVLDNDRRYDGAFFYGVASTGIFCRPSCPSRPPRRDRVRFFPTADAALAAGFRPCKRCRPDLTDFSPGQDVAAEAMALLHRHFRDQADLSAALNGLGLSRRRLADLFQAAYGHHPPRLPGNASGDRGLPPCCGRRTPARCPNSRGGRI